MKKSTLIFLLIGFLLFREFTRETKEHFDLTGLDSEALVNLASIAKKLSDGDDFTFPGNLVVSGNLTTNNKLQITATGTNSSTLNMYSCLLALCSVLNQFLINKLYSLLLFNAKFIYSYHAKLMFHYFLT